MGGNKVLDSTRFLTQNPQYVFINHDKIWEVAGRYSKEDLKIPRWNFGEHPSENEKFEDVVDTFFLCNSINFAFTDFETGEKFKSYHKGEEFVGSSAMWACVKHAIENGTPLLDADYLANFSEDDMEYVFSGNIKIPMFNERIYVLNQVGKVLKNKYDGHFHNLLSASKGKMFGRNGVVKRLTRDFDSFNDSFLYGNDKKVEFNKRAQLAGGMLYGRFQNTNRHPLFSDVDESTVAADYVLPKGLRDMGIFIYEESLAERVDGRKLIPAYFQEELEIRASTIHACNEIVEILNEKYGKNVNAWHIYAKIWSEARKNKETRHHLTRTIAY